jgi:N-acetylneuraminic acid mutarotase
VKTIIQTSFLQLLLAQLSFTQGSWSPAGDMPENRYFHTVNELAGKICVVGGKNAEVGAVLKTALVYERSSGVWTQIPLFNNKAIYGHTSCVVGGKLYVIGGNDSSSTTLSTMAMLDPTTDLWVSRKGMPTDRSLAACASIEGKIYVIGGGRTIGGNIDASGLQTVEVYDTTNDTWTALADMPTRRWGHSAVALHGKIYVVGGVSFGSVTTVYASVEVYDPQKDSWTTNSGMPTARYNLTCCALDSSIFAIGGWYNSGSGPIYDKVEIYNPESDKWNTENPLPVARAGLASIVLDGKISVYGGSRTNHPLIGTSAIYEFSTISSDVEGEKILPTEVSLEQNYPNPFNPSTTIRYALPIRAHVTVNVFNTLGQHIVELVNGDIDSGTHDVKFDGTRLASGVYYYRLIAGAHVDSKKLLLMK